MYTIALTTITLIVIIHIKLENSFSGSNGSDSPDLGGSQQNDPGDQDNSRGPNGPRGPRRPRGGGPRDSEGPRTPSMPGEASMGLSGNSGGVLSPSIDRSGKYPKDQPMLALRASIAPHIHLLCRGQIGTSRKRLGSVREPARMAAFALATMRSCRVVAKSCFRLGQVLLRL
ncbi:uncharacterized protein LY79DRAFT_314862 [Colletotrichum navitas]|uniref:Uncharacterized protein n=1 Tax=Colletotrichum navitas TaxID=681940 RepID=A0AAD8V1T5_9PEZI|nr:uncharacterized protein LY79DRAFT_314862 [Colletotrichum navitas]KAK1580102.1 hypothetical protein LY79DRAFT_314862 [Colletotrichum navitas]